MTYRNKTVAVVVPAYNEEAFVGDVIAAVPTFVDRVYPVDDCSTDDTWAVMGAAATEENRRRSATEPYECVVEPVQHETNRGAGAAILTGYEAALGDGVDVVAAMDGDGQMDPAFLPALLDPVVSGDVAYAKGNRLADPAHIGEMSRWRLFGNTLLTGLTRIASGYWQLRDPQNGYTVASAAALESLDFDRLYDRYGFLNDVLVHLSVCGFRIADVSHPASYGDETSGIRYLSFVPRLSGLLLRRFWWRLSQRVGRDGDYATLTAFASGTVGLVAALTGWVTGRSSPTESRHGGPRPARRRGRTDGGVEETDTTATRTLLVALVLLCLGTLLDVRRCRGEVVKISGTAHDETDGNVETQRHA